MDERAGHAALLSKSLARPPAGAPPDVPGVLVVDDEELVGAMLGRLLGMFGCPAFQALSGPEAVERFRAAKGDIGLVLLDVRMPGMDGLQTLQALRAIEPQVTCCFMTGDSGMYTDDDLRRQGALGVLRKPFRLDQVEQLLRQTVFAPRGAAPAGQ